MSTHTKPSTDSSKKQHVDLRPGFFRCKANKRPPPPKVDLKLLSKARLGSRFVMPSERARGKGYAHDSPLP